jgi:hypothetical protein
MVKKFVSERQIKEWCNDFLGDINKEGITMLTSYINFLIRKEIERNGKINSLEM